VWFVTLGDLVDYKVGELVISFTSTHMAVWCGPRDTFRSPGKQLPGAAGQRGTSTRSYLERARLSSFLRFSGAFQKMLANIAPMARRSATVTAAVAAVMVALSAVLAGHKGLIGAAIAVVVVAAFFGMSVLALSRAAKINAQAMMLAGMGTYLVKILVLLFLVGRFQDSTAFNPFVFGLTAIVLVLVYDIVLAITWTKTKQLYVEPDGER
jgi:ATP synthase protein I